ncbi:hypothetical protein J2X76_006251 [Neorhizobium sp. 2083]|nr:hypothetical protein [Neorhizobium sp. 2083]
MVREWTIRNVLARCVFCDLLNKKWAAMKETTIGTGGDIYWAEPVWVRVGNGFRGGRKRSG